MVIVHWIVVVVAIVVYTLGLVCRLIVWADVETKQSTCGRCKKGLTPEWEY
jgi:hypothetical protein